MMEDARLLFYISATVMCLLSITLNCVNLYFNLKKHKSKDKLSHWLLSIKASVNILVHEFNYISRYITRIDKSDNLWTKDNEKSVEKIKEILTSSKSTFLPYNELMRRRGLVVPAGKPTIQPKGELRIKDMTIDGDTAVRIMKCLKEHEPDIWQVLRTELKNGYGIGSKSDEQE